MWRVLGLCSDPAVTDVASFTTELSEPLLHLGEVGVGSILDPKERTQVKPRCASQRLVRFVPPGGSVASRFPKVTPDVQEERAVHSRRPRNRSRSKKHTGQP